MDERPCSLLHNKGFWVHAPAWIPFCKGDSARLKLHLAAVDRKHGLEEGLIRCAHAIQAPIPEAVFGKVSVNLLLVRDEVRVVSPKREPLSAFAKLRAIHRRCHHRVVPSGQVDHEALEERFARREQIMVRRREGAKRHAAFAGEYEALVPRVSERAS